MLSVLETPIWETKLRIAAAVYPRRRRPEMVGIRGSSQPATCFSCTSLSSHRLDITV